MLPVVVVGPSSSIAESLREHNAAKKKLLLSQAREEFGMAGRCFCYCTVMLTGFEAKLLATTYSMLGPVSMLAGTSKFV